MTSADPNRELPDPAIGLEPAVAVPADHTASQALAALRGSGANVVVATDTHGRPCSVVPQKTLVNAPGSRPLASCKPAWHAVTFHEPATAEERQRNAELWRTGSYEPVPYGSRTVVMRGIDVLGLIAVPKLFNRPGRATRLLERVVTPAVGMIIKPRR